MRVVNALLLAWPFVPPGIVAVVLSVSYASPNHLPRWVLTWGVLVWLYGVPWFLVGVLVALVVLLACPPARLMQRHVRIPAVSIGLDAVGMALYWLATPLAG